MAGDASIPRVPRRAALVILAVVAAAGISGVFFLHRIPQDPSYHSFADTRTLLSIPDCLNVLSNVPFFFVGVFGLKFVLGGDSRPSEERFQDAAEKWPYAVFFFGVTLTSFGSGYYHWAPGNNRLMWDRLPMAFAFMGILSACIVERISRRAGLILLGPFVAFGAGSVIYWHFTELNGAGDLRPYVLAQFLPLILIPAMMALLPCRYTRGTDLLVALGIYVVAKILELADRPIFEVGGVVSGHSLKHLAAALSAYWILRMLQLRRAR
jgi:hypothetical protein